MCKSISLSYERLCMSGNHIDFYHVYAPNGIAHKMAFQNNGYSMSGKHTVLTYSTYTVWHAVTLKWLPIKMVIVWVGNIRYWLTVHVHSTICHNIEMASQNNGYHMSGKHGPDLQHIHGTTCSNIEMASQNNGYHMSGKHGSDLQHIHGTTCSNIEMASQNNGYHMSGKHGPDLQHIHGTTCWNNEVDSIRMFIKWLGNMVLNFLRVHCLPVIFMPLHHIEWFLYEWETFTVMIHCGYCRNLKCFYQDYDTDMVQ